MSSIDIRQQLSRGFKAIRAAHDVPEEGAEPLPIRSLAEQAVIDASVPRRDATSIEFVTLDPAASTDLDQAFAVHREGDEIVLLYAIADIGAFVPRGSEIEAQAFVRGVTVYCPDGSVPLYPRILSKDRASLLPDGPRPAILLTVVVDPEGTPSLRQVERSTVLSRAKWAYEHITDADLSADTLELAKRISAAEMRRGAFRVDRAEQEVVIDPLAPGGLRLEFAPKRLSEERNAALSLATNLAVASHFLKAGVGLFRVMDEPGASEMRHLRNFALSSQIEWAEHENLYAVVGRLDLNILKHREFSHEVRQVGGSASYLPYPVPFSTAEERRKNAQQIAKPWHAAVAASYAHATAPMRRLADRYVLDLLVAQFANDTAAVSELLPLLAQLPPIMEVAERRASAVSRESIDLIESLMLQPLLGQELIATIIDMSPGSWQVQIQEPAVIRRVRVDRGRSAKLGESVQVRVVQASPRRSERKTPTESPNFSNDRASKSAVDPTSIKALELMLV